jgi:hypothetical protein
MNHHILESLENRRLFSSLTPFAHVTATGTLMIHGTVEDDSIDVILVHGRKENGIGITFQYKLDGSSNVNTIITQVKFNTVKRIVIDSGAGDDTISMNGPMASNPPASPGDEPTFLPLPATVLGGAGNDTISHDTMGSLFASGGDGNDTLSAISIANVPVTSSKNSKVLDDAFANATTSLTPATLMGGAGDDQIFAGFNDQVDGGAGNDTGNVTFSSTTPTTSNDRFKALGHDFFQRIGATSLEQFEAPNIIITDKGGSFLSFNTNTTTLTKYSFSNSSGTLFNNNDLILTGTRTINTQNGNLILVPGT